MVVDIHEASQTLSREFSERRREREGGRDKGRRDKEGRGIRGVEGRRERG